MKGNKVGLTVDRTPVETDQKREHAQRSEETLFFGQLGEDLVVPHFPGSFALVHVAVFGVLSLILRHRQGSVIVSFDVLLKPGGAMNTTALGAAFTEALLKPGALGNFTADPSFTSFEGTQPLVFLHAH